MGVYSKYLETNLSADFAALTAERKKQLQRISDLRDRDVLVLAADMGKQLPGGITNSINFEDRLPFYDQIENLRRPALDLILETPGGCCFGATSLCDAGPNAVEIGSSFRGYRIALHPRDDRRFAAKRFIPRETISAKNSFNSASFLVSVLRPC
jgi:hypothetical protein